MIAGLFVEPTPDSKREPLDYKIVSGGFVYVQNHCNHWLLHDRELCRIRMN